MIDNNLLNKLKSTKNILLLPLLAKKEFFKDNFFGLGRDYGVDKSVSASIDWLCRAQDSSITKDGGVARHYSLISGWGPSYPETTGYIIPTMLEYAERCQDTKLMQRAKKMLDWLVEIQLPDGGFYGGVANSNSIVPVTFNTGQILLGLSKGAENFGEPYTSAMHRAAEWLVNSQDPDGCWRKHHTPFAAHGEKTYETHVAWGLLESARVSHEQKYADSAIKNVQWALTKQLKNGWFEDCCLNDSSQPLTHTIGYVLRGIIEAYKYTKYSEFLDSVILACNGLIHEFDEIGFLPARLDRNWKGTVSYACLTGNVQIAYCLFFLYNETKYAHFRDVAYKANEFVRRTVNFDINADVYGGIKGSFPVSGDYGKYQYLNWAVKFFIDSNLMEQKIRMSEVRL